MYTNDQYNSQKLADECALIQGVGYEVIKQLSEFRRYSVSNYTEYLNDVIKVMENNRTYSSRERTYRLQLQRLKDDIQSVIDAWLRLGNLLKPFIRTSLDGCVQHMDEQWKKTVETLASIEALSERLLNLGRGRKIGSVLSFQMQQELSHLQVSLSEKCVVFEEAVKEVVVGIITVDDSVELERKMRRIPRRVEADFRHHEFVADDLDGIGALNCRPLAVFFTQLIICAISFVLVYWFTWNVDSAGSGGSAVESFIGDISDTGNGATPKVFMKYFSWNWDTMRITDDFVTSKGIWLTSGQHSLYKCWLIAAAIAGLIFWRVGIGNGYRYWKMATKGKAGKMMRRLLRGRIIVFLVGFMFPIALSIGGVLVAMWVAMFFTPLFLVIHLSYGVYLKVRARRISAAKNGDNTETDQ